MPALIAGLAYLDTSAYVKLPLGEEGHEELRQVGGYDDRLADAAADHGFAVFPAARP